MLGFFMTETSPFKSSLLSAVSHVVAAYVSAHKTSLAEIPHVISYIYQAFTSLDQNLSLVSKAQKMPAVPVEESVFDAYIVCLEDGKKLQMLKRHLQTAYGMTLQQYKERWGLPFDYPTVAPNYARRRSSIAQKVGLGKNGRKGRGHLKAVAA